ncbi:MAG: DNA repair protein RadC [Candidatus Eisenbacteria bacterium]|uniref:DNA repair protein RadC n=1 Tax=Eiseniibacteriota bacterium TaxID=2212470 RepID=A0A538T2D4_UNCEI|nr:MAG: DNA repair protein RadC [Candidatus Eisenbacteria bacterium]
MRRKKRSTIEDMMEEERPRERLLESGPGVLTDADLVAVLFGTGGPGAGVLELSARVTAALPLRQLHRVPVEELLLVKGLGHARAAQLLAAAELGRRLWPDGDAAALVRGPETVFDLTRDIRGANREHFVGFYLNSRNQVLRREIISIGSLNASIVHPREVYQPAIAVSAASLILAHNHPSGDPTPSEEDLAITRRLVEAGRILGIDILDHVVVAKDAYASFKERKLLHA